MNRTHGVSGLPEAPLWKSAMSGSCPRCGAPSLFEAPARVAIRCENCGLELATLERGGRFAGLVTILVAALLIALAIGVDITLRPPFWLQAAIWGPVTIVAVIGVLRFYKTALLYRQYELRAEREEVGK
ncbi:MAG: DUF983 domain-containing protein [Pseudomonadota bacterium]